MALTNRCVYFQIRCRLKADMRALSWICQRDFLGARQISFVDRFVNHWIMKLRLSIVVFLAFGLTSLVGALVMAAGLSFALSWGLNSYHSERDSEKLDEFVQQIEAQAQRLETSQKLEHNENLLLELVLMIASLPPLEDLISAGPGRLPPEVFEARLIIFGATGKKLFGAPLPPDHILSTGPGSREVIIDGRKIGSLMVIPRALAPPGVNAGFLASQYRIGGFLILMLLLINLIPAWLIARAAEKLVHGVKEATGDIVSGNFQKRAPYSSITEISEVTSDINVLAKSLESLEGARRKWLAEVSHELRTPLAAMTAEADALADGVRPYSPDAMSSLKEETTSLGRLVNDLNFYAVSDLSVPTFYFDRLDPITLCEDAIDRFKSTMSDKELAIEFDVRIENALCVNWDKGRIEQVISNILTNSIRYTEEPGKIHVTFQECLNSVNLVFEDSPPGVASEDMKRLFDPLFRAQATRGRAKDGTGLGLSVAAKIIQAHHGSITADDSDLGGLRLTVNLPNDPNDPCPSN